jgi:hypothetical protein
MLREPEKTPRAAKAGKEAKGKKRRFQIVKLEERIAPGGNGKTGARDQCNGNKYHK